ncbi:MarR family winged helix-turn-helix transcriptional regulator [Fundicoccus culcitae]|uniref:MarR family transcriptional regulator n=1 Tax=Fundicoccus culcitae TaxID=2969821 RepID=A0ABY5P6C6_9LACT|nr:MarR family transcriptional regulator [Fundicoccus culcitae]UUX34297.1 MarR family transcriptional regulator [Fundicoccus culcitae]
MDRQEEALKAFIGLKRTQDLFDTILKKDVTQHGLTLNEFAVLELLYHRGEQAVQKIKERILIASSSTTYVIDRLCSKGYVTRRPDQVDKRVIYVNLTESGHSLIESMFPEHAELIESLFSQLTTEEIHVLRENLKLISQTIRENLNPVENEEK